MNTLDNRAVVMIGGDVGKSTSPVPHLWTRPYCVGEAQDLQRLDEIKDALVWAKTLGPPLLAIDQTGSPAALLRHFADEAHIDVLYVTGLQARRAADLTPGRAKTIRLQPDTTTTNYSTYSGNGTQNRYSFHC